MVRVRPNGVVLLAVAMVGALLGNSPASGQATGTINGNVTGVGGAAEGIVICSSTSCDTTDVNGAYQITGLDPAVDHVVVATDPNGVYANETHQDSNIFDVAAATPVQVPAGGSQFVPFSLDLRGTIEGVVSHVGMPVANTIVCAFWGDPMNSDEGLCAESGPDGMYALDYPYLGEFFMSYTAPDGYLSESGFPAAAPVVSGQAVSVAIDLDAIGCDGLFVTVDLSLGQMPTTGDDVILGTNDADVINGLAGDDTICGLGGDDVINGGGGADTIYGGSGDDVLGGQGDVDTIYGQGGADRLNGGLGADVLWGGAGDDDLRGQGGGDIMYGQGGVDQFFGGSGDDEITTGLGGNRGSAQVVRGGGNNDTIYGSSGDDFLEGGSGLNVIFGYDGDDHLRAGAALDNLFGGDGNDLLEGTGGRDFLRGGNGDDVLLGGLGNDDLFGESGDDELDGQGGTDLCDGGTAGEVNGDRLRLATTCETAVDIP